MGIVSIPNPQLKGLSLGKLIATLPSSKLFARCAAQLVSSVSGLQFYSSAADHPSQLDFSLHTILSSVTTVT